MSKINSLNVSPGSTGRRDHGRHKRSKMSRHETELAVERARARTAKFEARKRKVSAVRAKAKAKVARATAEIAKADAEKVKAAAAKAKADLLAARANAMPARAEVAKARVQAAMAKSEAQAKRKSRPGDSFKRSVDGNKNMSIRMRGLLVKTLGMLGSVHEGELANAAKFVEKQRNDTGMSWDELIVPGIE